MKVAIVRFGTGLNARRHFALHSLSRSKIRTLCTLAPTPVSSTTAQYISPDLDQPSMTRCLSARTQRSVAFSLSAP